MRVAFIRRAVAAVSTAIIVVAHVYAQETTGTIIGSLIDQTAAVLPGVRVVIKSADTGQTREVTTNTSGQYTADLPVGRYDISFYLPQFQPFTTTGISLHLNDRLQVNARLNVGAVETLTVTAQRLVQPTSAVQTLIQQAAIRELPLLTRTPIQLVTLVPGVSSDLREDACFCDQGNLNITVNGARRSAVNWLLDGASNVNGWNNYTLVTTPSLDAIQEINVITSSYAAEWARNGGGVVNVITKAGTNRFSGSAYEFLRNDGLNANSFFRNMDPRPEVNGAPPRLRYNNFGYTIGGPALPGREKLFFFFSQEWRRSTRDKNTALERVPDPTWLTNTASPNYVAPEARDPNAVRLLPLWPLPNVPGTNQYRTTITRALDTRQEFVRADYHASANWSLTGRYLHDRVDSHGDYVTRPDLDAGHRYVAGDLATVEAQHVRGAFVYELFYQLSTNTLSRTDPSYTRANLGIAISEMFPENVANLVPNVAISGVDSLTSTQPWPREYLNQTFGSAVTLRHGSHTVKTGGLFALEHMNSNLIQKRTQGSFLFQAGGGFTAFQNFLRGNAGGACGTSCTYSETDTDAINRFRSRRYEVFVQDTWRIHPTATLDLGLRYAFYPPITDATDLLFTFAPDTYDPRQAPTFADDPDASYIVVGTGNPFNGMQVAGRDSPYGRAIYAADKNNLQPRIGAAWDPRGAGRLIVRAGYGMYFDETPVDVFAENVQGDTEWAYSDPFRTDAFVSNVSLSNPAGGPQGNGCMLLSGVQVDARTCAPWWTLVPRLLATASSFVAPRWQHWNVGVQRRLYSRGIVDAGYVGGRGDHLSRLVNINQTQAADQGGPANLVRPFPGYDAIFVRETTAKSRYHGLLVGFRHEAGQAGSATASYTLSRNQADATYDDSGIDNPQNALNKDAEFAAAGTDRTHIFAASYVYELPFARKATGGWRKALLGGWQIAGITRIESGPAVRIQVANCNYSEFGCQLDDPLRPNQVGDPAAGRQDGLLWFDPAAFVPPLPREYGTAPVAPFRLPGRYQWDFAFSKSVTVRGTTRLQIRADLINAFNQTQFLDVSTGCAPLAEQASCSNTAGPGGFGKVTSTRPPREVQLGIRVAW